MVPVVTEQSQVIRTVIEPSASTIASSSVLITMSFSVSSGISFTMVGTFPVR